ncbi:MAG: hypothetical protein E7455_09170 [Ruminococcaceae bacterium]|nr:hypothetical protein [Oscillospiraceae bacterium]
MARWLKIALILLGVLLAVAIVFAVLVCIWWNGGFDCLFVSEIATYDSPDGKYTLVFEQVGSPTWPFGPVDVRLTLRNSKGVYIDQISALVYNDGTGARPDNIKSIQWGEDGVVVILDRFEQPDQGFTFFYEESKPSAINPIT